MLQTDIVKVNKPMLQAKAAYLQAVQKQMA